MDETGENIRRHIGTRTVLSFETIYYFICLSRKNRTGNTRYGHRVLPEHLGRQVVGIGIGKPDADDVPRLRVRPGNGDDAVDIGRLAIEPA
jgi:hypothetical protein